MSDWMAILRDEVAKSSVAAVAREIGYARTSLSLVLHGRYQGSTDRVAARVLECFADHFLCPHQGSEISPASCRELRDRPMPTSSARDLRQWTACQHCQNNPNRKPARAEVA